MKPKVAFFDFSSCEGCQLQIANLEERIIDLVEVVDVVSFREVMKEHSDDYEIAIVEGSIQRPMDELRLKDIRSKAKILNPLLKKWLAKCVLYLPMCSPKPCIKTITPLGGLSDSHI